MLNEITWKHFFIGIGLIAVVYYVVVLLVLFRNDFFRMLRGHGRPFRQAQLPDLDDDESLAERFENRLDEAHDSASVDSRTSQNDLMTGTVADLMQDIKALAHVVAQNESSMEETESFFRMLLSRYAQLVGTPYQEAINEALIKLLGDDMLLPVTLAEVQSWWPKVPSN